MKATSATPKLGRARPRASHSRCERLAFLYTGSAKTSRNLALLYVPIAILFAYATYATPQTLRVTPWLIGLDDSHPTYRLTYALVGLPPIIASLAYYALIRRVEEPLLRLRIRLVSLTIAAYVASGLAARLIGNDLLAFITLVGFGIAAAWLVLIAYNPPMALSSRLEGGRSP